MSSTEGSFGIELVFILPAVVFLSFPRRLQKTSLFLSLSGEEEEGKDVWCISGSGAEERSVGAGDEQGAERRRRDGVAARDRAAAGGLHHGLLRQRPHPSPPPRLPRLYYHLPPHPIPIRLPQLLPLLLLFLSGNLPRLPPLPALRRRRNHRRPLPASRLRPRRLRPRGRSRRPVGHPAPFLPLLPDPHGEHHLRLLPLLSSRPGDGPPPLHRPPDLSDRRLGRRRLDAQVPPPRRGHQGFGLAVVRAGTGGCQLGLLLHQPLRLPHTSLPPQGLRALLQGEGRGARQVRRGPAPPLLSAGSRGRPEEDRVTSNRSTSPLPRLSLGESSTVCFISVPFFFLIVWHF